MQLFSKSGFWTSRLFIISISIGIQWLFDNHLLDIHWGFDSRGKRSTLCERRILGRGFVGNGQRRFDRIFMNFDLNIFMNGRSGLRRRCGVRKRVQLSLFGRGRLRFLLHLCKATLCFHLGIKSSMKLYFLIESFTNGFVFGPVFLLTVRRTVIARLATTTHKGSVILSTLSTLMILSSSHSMQA